jgi:sec-independent protein translocase protein TatA
MEWILLLLVVVLLLFGAKKIPELARSIGKATGEFKRGQREVEREIRDASEEPKKKESKVVKAAKALGIDTKGKTDNQLKKEIAEHVG